MGYFTFALQFFIVRFVFIFLYLTPQCVEVLYTGPTVGVRVESYCFRTLSQNITGLKLTKIQEVTIKEQSKRNFA